MTSIFKNPINTSLLVSVIFNPEGKAETNMGGVVAMKKSQSTTKHILTKIFHINNMLEKLDYPEK